MSASQASASTRCCLQPAKPKPASPAAPTEAASPCATSRKPLGYGARPPKHRVAAPLSRLAKEPHPCPLLLATTYSPASNPSRSVTSWMKRVWQPGSQATSKATRARSKSSSSRAANPTPPIASTHPRAAMFCAASRSANCCRLHTPSIANSRSSPRSMPPASPPPEHTACASTTASSAPCSTSWKWSPDAFSGMARCRHLPPPNAPRSIQPKLPPWPNSTTTIQPTSASATSASPVTTSPVRSSAGQNNTARLKPATSNRWKSSWSFYPARCPSKSAFLSFTGTIVSTT